MVAKITKGFRLHTAKQFLEQFDEEKPSNIYFFIANATPWPNESEPPEPIDSISGVDYDIWRNIIAMKKVSPADVSFGIPRIDWAPGSSYAQYTSNTEFHNGNFYVITEDFNVYKCLSNNNGGVSSVKPTGQLLVPLTTNDGYIWKYMYTVAASDALKFTTNKYIPAKTLTSSDDSRQWAVQQAAINGDISYIKVDQGGFNYLENTGQIALGGTNNIRVASTASNINDVYNGYSIFILSGTGINQIRKIVDYDGSNKIVKVDTPFTTSLDASTTYLISPTISVTGDGAGTVAYSRVEGGAIVRVYVVNSGANYSYADVAVTANNGISAVVTAGIAPPGGHGANPVDELYAHNVIMNIKLKGNEANTFMAANDFRTVGLIADPYELDGTPATDLTYNQTTVLNLGTQVLSFTKDELITDNAGRVAYVVEYIGADSITITGNRKQFVSGTTITGSDSGATATITSVSSSSVKDFTGTVLYIENRSPTTRSLDQEEDVKIIVKL